MKRVLVANRGEIARRIIRSVRRLGLEAVAVYSDADRDAPHVREADVACRLGPARAAESYLSVAALLGVAAEVGADAVHPGYGFLSENAGFVEACERAGLTFVGPSARVVRAMGSKREAKRIARDAGVPVVPGYDGDDDRDERLVAEAQRVGFPLLVKASAGGGGKGMRIVRASAELVAAVASARREAKSAFGDDALLIERYVEEPRHIEVQIFGDRHGHVVHLGERECSIQRRHQKVIEETPSLALDDALRTRITGAAVALGRALGYESAGTVEFVLGPTGEFFFLEVNTRLQVEHPVTEMVTGLDLVAEQLRVARGEPLSFAQSDVRPRGAAIELRLYAEDPANGYLPASGTLTEWHTPTGEGLRVDAGVERGSVVGIDYDPMLAKLIAWGESRAIALDRARRLVHDTLAVGVTTNRALLGAILSDADFRAGRIDTHYLERRADLAVRPSVPDDVLFDAAIAVVLGPLVAHPAHGWLPAVPVGYRNVPTAPEITVVRTLDGEARPVAHRAIGRGPATFSVETLGRAAVVEMMTCRADGASRCVSFRRREAESGREQTVQARYVEDGARRVVVVCGLQVELEVEPRFPEARGKLDDGASISPMPARVVAVRVAAGERVTEGASLLVLEAMKMEHTVHAARDGIVREVFVVEGEQVAAGAPLVVIEAEAPLP